MKIYCNLYDAVPFTHTLRKTCESKDMNLVRQVGECYTFASLNTMFTGKLGCDLLEGGFGYKTRERFSGNGKLVLPWSYQQIPDILFNGDWDIYIHNKPSIYTTLVNNDYYNKISDILALMHYSKAESYHKSSKFTLLAYELEKKYIQMIQTRKTGRNEFHFFYYEVYHNSLSQEYNVGKEMKIIEAAEKRICELIECWDTTEEEALFWFFSDHGDWRKLERNPLPEHYLSWVLFKDNINTSIEVNSKYISIRDFYATIIDKLKLEISPKIHDIYPIQNPQDKDRIYFVEDSRSDIQDSDKFSATVAVACKFIDWVGDDPKNILQVKYCKMDDTFVCAQTSLDEYGMFGKSVELDLPVCSKLKEALISRIGWI